MRVERFQAEGRWYLRLVGATGSVLSVSKGHWSKWGAGRVAKKTFPNLQLVDRSR